MNKKTTGSKRSGIIEYLSIKAELPCDVLSGEMRVEIMGRNTIFVHGCKRIIKYSSKTMILALKDACLQIIGERLVCSTYHSGVVTVEGTIKGVLFGDAEELI